MGAKLRRVAISVPDPDRAAAFCMSAFGMEKVGEAHNPTADGVCLSDGTVNLALLRSRRDDMLAGDRTREWTGIHHIGFRADDADAACRQAEAAGARHFMGETAEGEGVFYEVKYADPDGNMFDIPHNGRGGARRDGPPPAGEQEATR